MPPKSTEERLKDLMVEQLGVDREQITPAAKFIEDLGADSLDTVEIVMAVEEVFDLEIEDDAAEKLLTFGDLLKYVEQRVQNPT